MSLDASLNRIRPFTEELYRELHAHPELSHHEYRTAGRMAGAAVQPLEPSNGSEDFPDLPAAWGAPYVFWNFGGFDPQLYSKAQAAGTIAEQIPSNHAPNFLPALQPTLDTATKAMVTAALTFLDGPPGGPAASVPLVSPAAAGATTPSAGVTTIG